jgi:predicted nucleotidyltransferase
MRIHNALDVVLSTPTKVRLLRTVLAAPSRRWTGRELAAASKVSTAQTARDLRDFSDVGILRWEAVGRSFSWQLNHDHVLSETLASLFSREAGLRTELLRGIRMELRGIPLERALVFGSVARGEEQADSDVDLFVQLRDPSKSSQLTQALDRVRRRIWNTFGNPLSPLIYTNSPANPPPDSELLGTVVRDGLDVLSPPD